MTVKEAIEKAKKKGYFWDNECEYVCDASHIVNKHFWQALGKSMGWCEGKVAQGGGECTDCSDMNCENNHFVYWHKLIDHLAEGGSIEDYFKDLK